MEQSWCESYSAAPRPAEPVAGILKPPRPGLFDPPRAQPAKTLRFRSEPEHIEAPQTERRSTGNNAELSDSSDASANSASSSSSSSSSSNSEETGGETPSRARPAAQSRPRDRTLSLPSWFSGYVKRCLASFATPAAEPVGRGRDGTTSSSDRDRRASDSDRGDSRPSRRRRRRAAAERYNPPSQDDMRWRVALSRYALLTVLGVVTLLFVVAAALHVTLRGDPRSLVEQQPAAVTVEEGEDDGWPARRALKTSAVDDDFRPGRDLTMSETDSETYLATTEGAPTTVEPPTSGVAEQVTVDLVSARRAKGSSVPGQRT